MKKKILFRLARNEKLSKVAKRHVRAMVEALGLSLLSSTTLFPRSAILPQLVLILDISVVLTL